MKRHLRHAISAQALPQKASPRPLPVHATTRGEGLKDARLLVPIHKTEQTRISIN
jgi:hypothetical protein